MIALPKNEQNVNAGQAQKDQTLMLEDHVWFD